MQKRTAKVSQGIPNWGPWLGFSTSWILFSYTFQSRCRSKPSSARVFIFFLDTCFLKGVLVSSFHEWIHFGRVKNVFPLKEKEKQHEEWVNATQRRWFVPHSCHGNLGLVTRAAWALWLLSCTGLWFGRWIFVSTLLLLSCRAIWHHPHSLASVSSFVRSLHICKLLSYISSLGPSFSIC
jgi:hypothetical protein